MQEYIEFFKAHSMLSLAWVGLLVVLVISVIKSSLSKNQKYYSPRINHYGEQTGRKSG
ncbi:rhodanese-like sulfurtransferase [Shewanella sp. HN-41]|nr:rhodanese-like sulfurtransferase [Shewanella sp. HN-41]